MSLSSTMTSLMDKARANYHITDKLSIANLTDLMDKPAVNGPLSITYPNWTKASGWYADAFVTVPVFEGVPICATVEIKDIASTVSNQGPCLLCTFKDKNMNDLSYWDVDSNGNYKLAHNQPIQVGGNDFSNKNGLRSAQRLFNGSNLRNVSYIAISIGNNVDTTYSFRNLVVSYYEPYSVQNLIDGGNLAPLVAPTTRNDGTETE
ncbi:hypothetical protein [Limosilactobacillus mucosae]|uniref:hypothetical protein n=1 Tax=Limosilactobacillus mucosae TaxID=97478 RepID=UPI00233EB0EF|nr:hypothetical protein [Limosilactobacillus mucosae]MDC2841919.1 hypothetical protein [Limosilactobacillus mucosae]